MRDDMATSDANLASAWLKFLNQLPPDTHLALAREFGAYRDLISFINEPVPGPAAWQRLVHGFRCLSVFSMWNVFLDKYPSLTRCWNDLSKTFVASDKHPDRLDRIVVEAWIFCDFPLQETGKSCLAMFQDFLVEMGALPEFQPFIDAMSASRLGLHQEMSSTAHVIRFKELISGRTDEVFRSVEHFGKGEIFMSRIVRAEGASFIFGDPRCWPKESRNTVEEMVMNKMFLTPRLSRPAVKLGQSEPDSLKHRFESFMKIAGPYWMSCTVDEDEIPILMPDHCMSYYTRVVKPSQMKYEASR
jgi:hypothetical protein